MIDRARVEQHVTTILQMVDALRRHQDRTIDELRADIDLLSAVAHQMQIGIQSALDAGAHILVAGGFNEFQEYRQIPERLAAHGVIGPELGQAIGDLARFRNLLVHHYLLLRIDLVHARLLTAPAQIEAFAAAVQLHLDSSSR